MLTAVALLIVLPALTSSSGEGNIHLLEDEVATALRACTYNESTAPKGNGRNNPRRRSADYEPEKQGQYGNQEHRKDNETERDHNMNLYGQQRRNSTDQMYVLTATDNYTPIYGTANASVKYTGMTVMPIKGNNDSIGNWTRGKRSHSLINKSDQDQCLSQCVFANLQVVDGRGIPREAELWNMVQSVVTSHQSRIVLKDQIHACFQELQSEAEDNGCSYSNKLERCLMLRFSDRKKNDKNT